MSVIKRLAAATLVAGVVQFSSADTIQLKDGAVSGKILAEKPDSVVVDVGYSVLLIPRSSVISITKSEEKAAPTPVALPSATGQFYTANPKAAAVRDISTLVKQLGEAVVQVK